MDCIQTWWQRDDLAYQDKHLYFAGYSVHSLVKQMGTPLFLYSGERVKNKLQALHLALDNAGFNGRHSIYYAMKANRFAPLLTYLKSTGLAGIDACSPYEVEHAISCGFKASEISFTAGSLSQHDMNMLSGFDGLFINCDSLHAISSWGKRHPGSAIGIRINPELGIGRTDNDKLHYAGAQTTKFGIYKQQFAQALKLAAQYQLQIKKIHFHTGCGYLNQELASWRNIISNCLWFIEQVKDSLEYVNIGGGLGVPHVASDASLDLSRWAAILAEFFASTQLHIEVEPGDYIVKDAGLLLVEKTFEEQKKDLYFVGVNAGFNIAPEPAYYQLPFQAITLFWGEKEQATISCKQVVGNINEALDVWYQNAQLPDLIQHSHLAFINAGAYSSSMASNHCMRGQFKEVLLF